MSPNLPPSGEDELESRLTALLLGELSPDETAALRRRMETDPALRQLHDQLQETIALVREAAHPADEQAGTETPSSPKLSADRRAQLLEALKGTPPAIPKVSRRPLASRSEWLRIAAMIIALVFLSSVLVFYQSRPRAMAQRWGTDFDVYYSADTGRRGRASLGREPKAQYWRLPKLPPAAVNTPNPIPLAMDDQLGRARDREWFDSSVEKRDSAEKPAIAAGNRFELAPMTPPPEPASQPRSKASPQSALSSGSDRRQIAPVELNVAGNLGVDPRGWTAASSPDKPMDEGIMLAKKVAPKPSSSTVVTYSEGTTIARFVYEAKDSLGAVAKPPTANFTAGINDQTVVVVAGTAILPPSSVDFFNLQIQPTPALPPADSGKLMLPQPDVTRADGEQKDRLGDLAWAYQGTAGRSEVAGREAGFSLGAAFSKVEQERAAQTAHDQKRLEQTKNAADYGGVSAANPISRLPEVQTRRSRTLGGIQDGQRLSENGRLNEEMEKLHENTKEDADSKAARPSRKKEIALPESKREPAIGQAAAIATAGDEVKALNGRLVVIPEIMYNQVPGPSIDSATPVDPATGLPISNVLPAPNNGQGLLYAGVNLGMQTAPTPTGGVYTANAVGYVNLSGSNLIANPLVVTNATFGFATTTGGARFGIQTEAAKERVVSTPEARYKVNIALPGAVAGTRGYFQDQLRSVVTRAPQPESLSQLKASPSVNGETETINEQLGLQESRAVAQKSKEAKESPPAPPAEATEDFITQRRAAAPEPQPEMATSANPFSTFSLNVSDVSFKLAAAALEKGVLPEPATVRSEEFINAFEYHDPEPPPGVPLAFAWERARYPFAHNRDLVRFSVKTAATGRQPGRPLNLVLLLDNSGSMERADRVRIIRECLRVLAGQLQPQDRISVVAFARTPRLWVDGLPGNQAGELVERVGGLTPQGGTNLEDAMNLAYQTARRHYLAQGVNRVVLLTDGAANLGEVEPETLKKNVEAHRRQGIALDCFGIGWEGYNDDLLEVLSRNGDGRYGFVNSAEAATTEFANQLAGALNVAASDVKVQVEFNPQRVTTYRQIGYAKHQLKKEQFRDNTVDAAEIGAAESGNALYVVEANPNGQGPLAMVRVRYKVPATGEYHEHEWAVPFNAVAVPLEQSTPAMRLAAVAAAFSEWLVASPFAGEVTPEKLLGSLAGVPALYSADPRPQQLAAMLGQARAVAGK